MRFLLRFLPVLSVLKTVHRSVRLDNSGKFQVTGNGGAVVSSPPTLAAVPLSSPLPSNSGCPSLIGRLKFNRTLS
jgi:hypothetical protein